MIRKSNRDQERTGAQVAVPYPRARETRCAVPSDPSVTEGSAVHHARRPDSKSIAGAHDKRYRETRNGSRELL
jgi:hypothetical protein